MDKIYVVMGSTGEYSAHEEWYLKALADEEKAKGLVVRLSRGEEHDPYAQRHHYTDVYYDYQEVPFEE